MIMACFCLLFYILISAILVCTGHSTTKYNSSLVGRTFPQLYCRMCPLLHILCSILNIQFQCIKLYVLYSTSSIFYRPCMEWLFWGSVNCKVYNRGLQFYTFFGILIGIKRSVIDISQKLMFTFCKMFENVKLVFSHFHSKFSNFFWQINMGIKNAEVYVKFEFVDAGFKIGSPRKNVQKLNTENSHSFSAIAFL